MPVIVHGSNGDEDGDEGIQDTVLIGIDTTFRGHPENTFRIIGNAIYQGLRLKPQELGQRQQDASAL